MRAYHFLHSDMRTEFGDEPAWAIGETREITGYIALCERGYHTSPSFIAALGHAPGPIACIVDVSQPVSRDESKQVSRRRTLVAAIDATNVLRRWGLECARAALEAERAAGREPDKRSWNVLDVLEKHIGGAATDAELSAAESAAWSAARSARSAARSAAESARRAARSAARSAAEGARSAAESAAEGARSAAESAAGCSAESAAWSAAESARRAAESAARSAAESAARSAAGCSAWSAAESARRAAWSAALSAAESAQAHLLDQMMLAAFAEAGFKL